MVDWILGTNKYILNRNILFSKWPRAHHRFLCNDDDKLFLQNGWLTKGVKPYFQWGPLSVILTITNLGYAASSSIWACTKPEFRHCWVKLYSNDNCCTVAPQFQFKGQPGYLAIRLSFPISTKIHLRRGWTNYDMSRNESVNSACQREYKNMVQTLIKDKVVVEQVIWCSLFQSTENKTLQLLKYDL